jgi:NO-binding membrane sensor protein with MHYT domain
MAAMIMPATISYDGTLFYCLDVIASWRPRWRCGSRSTCAGNLQRFGSALVMGVAVCGMHYTGMYA